MKWFTIVRRNKRKNRENDTSLTQLLRHAVQIAGFLLLPGLFLLTLDAFRGVWQAVLGGQFTWSALGVPLLTLFAVLPVTALWERFFCGYLCAFGGMQELLSAVASRLGLPVIQLSERADSILRKAKYVVLAALVVCWTFGGSYESASPWQVFGRYARYDGWSDLSGWLTVGGVLLAAVMGLSLVTERGFCRYFCPLGGIFAGISRWRLFRVKQKGNCVGCGQCDAACPMGIDVSREAAAGSVTSAECIDCFRCVSQCGAKALYTAPREAVAGSAAAIAIAGLYQVGTIAVSSPIRMTGGLTALSQGQYPDGTYEGSAEGYRGTVTVKVVVAGGAIESITVESYRDDDQFFERAKNSVISEILASQSTDGVSTVSGATYSSRGIINAVADALGIRASVEAEASDDLPELPRHENSESENGSSQKGRQRRHSSDDAQASDKANDSNANQTAPDTGSSQTQTAGSDFAGLKDGTYSGQGQGRNGSIEVSVKVSGGKVTSITLESSNEDAPYLNRAKDTVIGEIIDSQSLNVQTVSGATMSSNGIIDAVANALGMSFTNPNSSMQRGHHH